MTHKRIKLEKLPIFSSEFYTNRLDREQIVSKYFNDEYKPANVLTRVVEQTQERRRRVPAGSYVAHLYMRDFRVADNHALSKARHHSKALGIPLITIYVHCPEDLKSHSVSEFQQKYRLETLRKLQQKLHELNIPLYTLSVERKKDISQSIVDFATKHRISHIFGNIEYEVDELRLFTGLLTQLSKSDIDFTPLHDSCVVVPGVLKSKAKKTQYSVFTPWYRAWCDSIESGNGIETYPIPDSNEKSFTESNSWLFECKIPDDDFNFTQVQKKNFEKWPTGEDAAKEAFLEYVRSNKMDNYGETRNSIADDTVSHMSPHITSGVITTRTLIKILLDQKKIKSVSKGKEGCVEYVRQLAWRDFYRHVLCNWPHISMFRPFNLDFIDLEWEYNSEHFNKWCHGKTGYPIVDASMRMLEQTGYMHNRCRMIVASFLSKHLLIDWRYGERYFMENLIDGDFASNNGGWGFSSSVGVDPQPYFRIFNPWTQSKKFDSEGNFIREWVHELKDVDDNSAIHNPHESKFKDLVQEKGYPPPIIDHKYARERALERYKSAR